MANVQTEQDSGVASYGPPDEEALAKLSTPQPQQPVQGAYDSVDDFLKGVPQGQPTAPAPQKQYASVDEFLNEGAPKPSLMGSIGSEIGTRLTNAKSTLSAFVGGSYDAATQDLGLSDDTKDWMRKEGVYNDYANGEQDFVKTLNEAILNRAAATADMAMRLIPGIGPAYYEGLAKAADFQHNDKLAEDLHRAPDAINALLMEGGIHMPQLPEPVARARASAVIGEGEEGFQGLKEPTPEQAQARDVAAAQLPEETPEPDIHAVARQIAPDTFNEYDPLSEQRDTLGAQMRELSANRPDEIAANAPHTDEIAQLQERLANEELTDRKTQRLQERLDDLTKQNQDYIEQETGKLSPEMETVRQAYEAVDNRMRDLAPDVTAAYRAAQERIPQPQEAPVAEAPAVIPKEITEAKAPPTAAVDEQKANIASDVGKQLVAAGRPQEEADAAAQLVAEHYQARAERFGGARGTAQEMYERDGANIRAARAMAPRARELAQEKGRELEQGARGKIRLASDNAKATITLMKTANASTFIHETGHHWLDELLHDAEDEKAPADLVKDAATVRKWLGAEVGEIATRQHEQFARGFERYMMEGTAPSKGLAGIFAKFKGWLTDIYQTVNKLRSPINNDIRDVFDRLLTAKPEKTVIAPERARGGLFADVHETDADTAKPEEAASRGHNVESEFHEVVKTKAPEVRNDIISRTEPETPQRSDDGTESDGDPDAPRPAAGEAGALPSSPPLNDSAGETLAKGNKASGVYQPVPRKPLTLIEWVKKNGGLKDTGGDIKAALGKGIKGLIRPKAGMHIDDMALKAHEAGYFAEKGAERPTTTEFLDKLIHDRMSKDQFSAHDGAALDAYNDAVVRNTEIDKAADKLGIDPAGKTQRQFWDEAREKMSVEDQATQAISLQESQNAIEQEAMRKEKEWLESRGDAWEPVEAKTRSLEDLENDYRSESASDKPQAGASLPEQSRPSPADSGAVQAIPGQGDGGAGTRPEQAGSDRSAPRDADRGPDASESVIDQNGNPKYDLIEKRIEKINTPDDVDNFIRNAAIENDAFSDARRGVVSHAETYAMAEAMGNDGAMSMIQKRAKGDALSAHQLKAAEALFKALSVDAYTKSKLPKTPENIAAFEAANQKFLMATSHFLGAASEAGRALNILRTMSTDLKAAKDVQEFFQRNTGKTADEISRQMDFMSKLDNPANQAAFIQASKRASFRSMMMEYYVNCLISGPLTHMRYMVGNVVKAVTTPLVEIPIAAAHGAIREALGREPSGDRVYLGEAGAQFYGMAKGARDGLRAAATAWKTGQSPFLPGEVVKEFQPNAIPGTVGKAINLPSNAISAIHSFSKSVRYEMNVAGLSYRTAMREGLKGDDFDRRVAQLTKAPTEEMMKSATTDALKELYMAPAEFGTFAEHATAITNNYTLAKVIVPFMKIGTNITREAFMERTPLGVFSQEVRDNLSGKNGGAARDMQMSKITTGTALMGATALMVAEGNATGDGPNDPKQRAQWLLTHRPNTLTIGDLTIPYQGLGSLGMLMRFSANMTETARAWNDEDGGKLALSFMQGITKSVLDDNWMRGVKDMTDAFYHPEEYGARYIQNMATNWLPFSVGLGQVSHMVDPIQRDIRSQGWENGFGIMDAARAKIPGLSESLVPRRDVFGQPISSNSRNYQNDPVVQRMDALRIFPSQLQRKIRGVELTEQQYDDYSRIAGNTVKMRLDKLVQQPGFDRIPPASQIEMINQSIKIYREKARAAVMMQNPEIMKQAMAAKRHDQAR